MYRPLMSGLLLGSALSASLYKVIHIAGVLLVFVGLGGLALRTMAGHATEKDANSKLGAVFHGIGMLLVIISGFGAMAALAVPGMPGWIVAKLVLWVALGAAMVLAKRKPETARALWFALPVLGMLAAYLAIYKPF